MRERRARGGYCFAEGVRFLHGRVSGKAQAYRAVYHGGRHAHGLEHVTARALLAGAGAAFAACSAAFFRRRTSSYRKILGEVAGFKNFLEVAEKLCDKVAIIDKGKLLVSGSMEEIRAKDDDHSLEDFFISVTQKEKEAEKVASLGIDEVKTDEFIE